MDWHGLKWKNFLDIIILVCEYEYEYGVLLFIETSSNVLLLHTKFV